MIAARTSSSTTNTGRSAVCSRACALTLASKRDLEHGNSLDTILNNKGHQLHVVEPEATVIEAVEVMNRERIGAVLVVVGEARLVGILPSAISSRG